MSYCPGRETSLSSAPSVGSIEGLQFLEDRYSISTLEEKGLLEPHSLLFPSLRFIFPSLSRRWEFTRWERIEQGVGLLRLHRLEGRWMQKGAPLLCCWLWLTAKGLIWGRRVQSVPWPPLAFFVKTHTWPVTWTHANKGTRIAPAHFGRDNNTARECQPSSRGQALTWAASAGSVWIVLSTISANLSLTQREAADNKKKKHIPFWVMR